MIDHDAAAELWDRYKRGERNGCSPGGSTPCRARRRSTKSAASIAAMPSSGRRWTAYIHEFERLLDEVSRGDRGQVVARTYLTSETGKVYTMLAHAAGRFEQ